MNKKHRVLFIYRYFDMETVEAIYEEVKDEINPWLDEIDFPPGGFIRQAYDNKREEVEKVAIFIGSLGFTAEQAQYIKNIVDSCKEDETGVLPIILSNVEDVDENLNFLRQFHFLRCHTPAKRQDVARKLVWGVNTPYGKTRPLEQPKASSGSTKNENSETLSVEELEQKNPQLQRLSNNLGKGRFRDANLDTFVYLMTSPQAGFSSGNQWIKSNMIARFRTSDIEAVDFLWQEHSNKRFGFSMQKQVFQDCGGFWNSSYLLNPNWYGFFKDDFCKRVDWQYENKWRNFGDCIFSLEAPPGHLPFWLYFLESEAYKIFLRKLMESRLRNLR